VCQSLGVSLLSRSLLRLLLGAVQLLAQRLAEVMHDEPELFKFGRSDGHAEMLETVTHNIHFLRSRELCGRRRWLRRAVVFERTCERSTGSCSSGHTPQQRAAVSTSAQDTVL
jgi:hypothetical protein